MNETDYRSVGRHLADQAAPDALDERSRLRWEFAQAVRPLPGGADAKVWLPKAEARAYWLSSGENGLVLGAIGKTIDGAADQERSAAVSVQARPLTGGGRWAVDLDSEFASLEHGHGFKESWAFSYEGETFLEITGERLWDRGDDGFAQDPASVFAGLLATAVGWSE